MRVTVKVRVSVRVRVNVRIRVMVMVTVSVMVRIWLASHMSNAQVGDMRKIINGQD